MKLVLDTNVLLSALMRESFTRSLLLHPRLELIMPEFALEEVDRHLPDLAERMGLPPEATRLTLELLLSNVTTVPRDVYAGQLGHAQTLVGDVDPDDAPFVALSLATGCPLWTQDKALLGSQGIRTLSSREVARFLQEGSA